MPKKSSKFSTNVWTDAYLAAFAITADIELVTFDQAFTQFKGLRSVILK
jgi:predicted nucleic acid-binding protein